MDPNALIILPTIKTVHQSIQGLYALNPGRYKQLLDKSREFNNAVLRNNIDEIKTTLDSFLQEAEKHRGTIPSLKTKTGWIYKESYNNHLKIEFGWAENWRNL